MDSKGQFGLTYADDFSMACTINNLKQEEVLQYFINRVSFYAFNGGEMEPVALWATNVVVDCKQAYHAQVKATYDKRVQRISIRYIGLLSDLEADIQLSVADKMKKSFYLMKDWEEEMLPHVDYPKTYELDEDHFLILTFDFNLLCRMNGVSPQQVLQYFVDKISLARHRAKNLFGFAETDSCMALFGMMLLSRSMKKSRLPVQQDIHDWYAERLLSLDERLKKEENLEKRISVYRAFYTEWYQALRKNIS